MPIYKKLNSLNKILLYNMIRGVVISNHKINLNTYSY